MRNYFVLLVVFFGNCYMQGQTLAESMGYNKNDRVVIINADDYGMCHSENLGTEKVLEYGIVSSATMMMPCPWINEAISYAKNNDMDNIGIHVALTSEWKNYRWRPMSYYGIKKNSLVDADGYLWSESHDVEFHAEIVDITAEIRAQLQTALNKGVNLSHFDSHMGSLYGMYTNRIELLALALAASHEFGLPFRLPFIPEMLEPFRNKGFAILDTLVLGANQPRKYQERKQYFVKLFANLPPGITEVYIHPAIVNEELKNITNAHQLRQTDVDIFTDPEIKKVISDNKVKVISYKPLKDWQRKQMKWEMGKTKIEDVFEEYREILEEKAKTSPGWLQFVRNKEVWRKK